MGSMDATFMSLMGHEITSYMYINYTGACSWCVHLMFTQQDCIHFWAALLNSSVLWCTIMGLQATMWHMSQHWKNRCLKKQSWKNMGCWLRGFNYNYLSFFNHNYLGWVVEMTSIFLVSLNSSLEPISEKINDATAKHEPVNIPLLTGEKRGWYYLV